MDYPRREKIVGKKYSSESSSKARVKNVFSSLPTLTDSLDGRQRILNNNIRRPKGAATAAALAASVQRRGGRRRRDTIHVSLTVLFA